MKFAIASFRIPKAQSKSYSRHPTSGSFALVVAVARRVERSWSFLESQRRWSLAMPCPQKDPLRPLTPEERTELERLSRAHSEPAALVARAKVLLAVAGGQRYTEAARAAGRRSGDA